MLGHRATAQAHGVTADYMGMDESDHYAARAIAKQPAHLSCLRFTSPMLVKQILECPYNEAEITTASNKDQQGSCSSVSDTAPTRVQSRIKMSRLSVCTNRLRLAKLEGGQRVASTGSELRHCL